MIPTQAMMGMSVRWPCQRVLAFCSMVGLILFAACAGAGPVSAAVLPAQFGSKGPGAGQFFEPKGIAVDQENGEVFIADYNNDRIDRFSGEGAFILAWGYGVADGENETLQVCSMKCYGASSSTTATGTPFAGGGAGQFRGPEGIAVDNSISLSHGDIYVVDAGNHRVQKFNREGQFILMFGGEVNSAKGNLCLAGEAQKCKAGIVGVGPGEFKGLGVQGLGGRSIAVDESGTVYVGDENRVQRFSEMGILLGEIKLPGVGLIENLAVDSSDDIYVKGRALAGVRKYNQSGTELGSPRDEAGNGEYLAVAIGSGDELFVNDFRLPNHRILGFDAAGAQRASFDAGGLAQNGTQGIAYSTATGALYILNHSGVSNEAAVRIVTPPAPGVSYVLPGSEQIGVVQPTSAKLEAKIDPEGPEVTSCRFEYGLTKGKYEHLSPVVVLNGGEFEDQGASAIVVGLSPGTTYHFRVVAENAAHEVSVGRDQSFTTPPAVSIDETSVSEVNATGARLEAELDPHGRASEYRFEYGTSTTYEKSTPQESAGAGSADTSVKNLVQELLPDTTYHYRVVAQNELGVVVGPDRAFTTQGESSTLPDGRAWEQVSPANKHGAVLEPLTEEGGLIKAAADGGMFTYVALGSVTGEANGVRSPEDSQLISTRGSSGWSTSDITTRHEEISKIHPGFTTEYKSFAEDLSAGIVEPVGATALSPDTTERTPYRRESNGIFVPLVTANNVLAGAKFGGVEAESETATWENGVEFVTATPDLSHVLLESPVVLTPGFKPGFNPEGTTSIYELASGTLQLVSILPSGQPTAEAGLSVGVGDKDINVRGAISNDGGHVIFEASNGAITHLFLRDVVRGETVQLDVRQAHAAGGSGGVVFQAASGDGKRVFFTDESRLTVDATAAPGEPDLYMCEIGLDGEGHLSCVLSDLSVDPHVGEAANVAGEVSAIDAQGEHVYFAASGVLTNVPNAEGEHAMPGECGSKGEASCNLYVYDTSTRQVSLVGVLSNHDGPDWRGGNTKFPDMTARSSPNGRYFTFMSQRSLTGYDNRDAKSGQLDEEVFLYDAESGRLVCVSCDPTGARPRGVFDTGAYPGLLVDHQGSWGGHWLAGSIPGWTLSIESKADYQSRYLSDSGRMFFNATDALVPQDTNGVEDVYEYEPPGVGSCNTHSSTFSPASGGCVGLISSGTAKEESAFLDASENGDEVFFLTQARLAPSDIDSAFDVYDAHVCSASSPCPPPPPAPAPACQGDACQNPSAAPNDQTPASLTYHGPGNASPPPGAAPAVVKTKAPSRTELLTRALRACTKKHARQQRLACERSARVRYGGAKAKAKRAGK